MTETLPVAIVGAGIAGLTFGLTLHARGIACRIYERADEITPLGVGINVLPHASRVLDELGLTEALSRVAVLTEESAFFNRFGQLIYREPLGRAAGYALPQYSIHRGDLQTVLLEAFVERAGADRLVTGVSCTGFDQHADGVRLHLVRTATGERMAPAAAAVAVGCDGIHSAIRRQIHPDEGPPKYSGIYMWRGVSRAHPFLGGATMVRAGWFTPGKMVIYPIRHHVDRAGSQLINWVVEIAMPAPDEGRDWNRPGRAEDFLPAFADWRFDWLDVPDLIRRADVILEFPMVDQDPLPFWTVGRVTLMGDAAHPMLPRGSNGAGQAILDAERLADDLAGTGNAGAALAAYQADRLDATSRVVLTNRVAPPDSLLEEVRTRTGDRPFRAIEDVISHEEMAAIQDRYREVAGYSLERLRSFSDGRSRAAHGIADAPDTSR
jgi:2-polyprenyl-6-methoxyphenol hydroxylase-like FAD-dependent oxidoreductase